MYNTSQSDFFDEHLSDVLREIVESDAEFLGEFFEKSNNQIFYQNFGTASSSLCVCV